MENTVANRRMAQTILNFIEAFPEKHDQSFWFVDEDENGCGTTMCIAGTATYLAYGKKAPMESAHQRGRELLGLTYGEAEVLFYEMNDERAVAKLRKVAQGIPFDKDDYYTQHNRDDPNSLEFNSAEWDEDHP